MERKQQVWALARREMTRLGYSPEQLGNASSLLDQYFERRRPRIHKPAVAAAALEYTIARIDFHDEVTQADVAARYEVSVSSVSRVHGDMVESLGIAMFDERFCTVEAPLEGALDLADLMLSGGLRDEALEAGQWDDPLFQDSPSLSALGQLPRAEEVWGGARSTLRSYILTPRPFRPDLVIFADEASSLIVGQRLIYPDDGLDAVLGALVEAMEEPAVGEPRRPRALLVPDEALARQLAEVLEPLEIAVGHGPAPSVEAALRFLERTMAADAPRAGYLDGGQVGPEVAARLFASAARLHAAAPWDSARDYQVSGVDLHRWGYERASVSIMGAGGVVRGLLIFRTLRDFLTFDQLASLADRTGRRITRPHVEVLSLSYQNGADLGAPLLKEVLRHGWQVADAHSYPVLLHTDPDNIAIPVSEESCLAAAACAEAVARMASKHPHVLSARGRWSEVPRAEERLEVVGEPVVISAPHPDLR